jgi:hypothetical protein
VLLLLQKVPVTTQNRCSNPTVLPHALDSVQSHAVAHPGMLDGPPLHDPLQPVAGVPLQVTELPWQSKALELSTVPVVVPDVSLVHPMTLL